MPFHHRFVVLLCVTGGCLFADPGPSANESGGAETGEGGSSVTQATTGEPTTEAQTSAPQSTGTTDEPAPGCAWEQVLTDKRPVGRIDAALALAPGGDEVLLYGGRVGLLGGDLEDTWTFDGERWRQVHDDEEDETPGPRRGHAMAYDAARDRVVLFGGEYGSIDVKFAAETWTHDGGSWTKRNSGPSQRVYAAMADLPRKQVVVLFGGRTDKGPDAETWIWDGQDWTRLEMVMLPPKRFGHVMSRDAAGDVLVYGGCGDPLCGKPLTDTWRFDGEVWTKLDGGAGMGVRSGGMAHATVEAQTLRLGQGESWRWADMKWMPAGPAEPALSHFVVADLPASGLVLFGGLTSKVIESDATWVLRCS